MPIIRSSVSKSVTASISLRCLNGILKLLTTVHMFIISKSKNLLVTIIVLNMIKVFVMLRQFIAHGQGKTVVLFRSGAVYPNPYG